MCYYELLSTIQIKEDIPVRRIQSDLSRLISNAMLHSAELKDLHRQTTVKPYVFSMPYPLEADRIYRKDRLYCFNIRSTKLSFELAIKSCLPKVQGNIRVMSSELRTFNPPHISELISLTPIISTVKNQCWMPENGLGLLAVRMHNNAVKKCKTLDKEFLEPDEPFYDLVELLNKKPIVVSYKDTTLLGHKLRLTIKPYKWSQQMAVTVMGQGLLEKNALGFGYCIARR